MLVRLHAKWKPSQLARWRWIIKQRWHLWHQISTSKENDSTTSDLERGKSVSSPMSRKLFMGVSLGLILGLKSLATGWLSRFAISRLTDDLSSSTYIISMSLEINFGHFLSYRTQQETGWTLWLSGTRTVDSTLQLVKNVLHKRLTINIIGGGVIVVYLILIYIIIYSCNMTDESTIHYIFFYLIIFIYFFMFYILYYLILTQ